jgi:transcriptional regulator with XRE-family HTH domain
MIRLQQLRLDAGLSPQRLGELAGVSDDTIRSIERRLNTNPQVATLTALAAIFGARPSELLMDALPPSRSEDVAA